MKKIWLLFLSVFCLCLVGCWEEEKEQTRQGIYYPVWLSHWDGEQTYWPIFTNYKACEERWLYELQEELRDSMCISECNGTVAWLPQCKEVIRSWKPFSASITYSGANEIRESLINWINEANEKLRKQQEEDERIAREKEEQERQAQLKMQQEQAAAKKKKCDDLIAEANANIAEIESHKSNYFCNNLNQQYEKIKQLENKIKNVNTEVNNMYKWDVPQYITSSTKANLVSKYQDEIDSTYRTISNYNINECNQEQMNNRKFDELILQRQAMVVNEWC